MAHREPYQVTGYTAQQGLAGTATFTNQTLAQPHGSPGPHDSRPGYLNVGEPGGIDPIITKEGDGGSTLIVKGDTPVPKGNPKGDIQSNAASPAIKRGWTSQSP